MKGLATAEGGADAFVEVFEFLEFGVGFVVDDEGGVGGDVVGLFDDVDHGFVGVVAVDGEDEELVFVGVFEVGEDESLGCAVVAGSLGVGVEVEDVDFVLVGAGFLGFSGEEPVSDFCEHVVVFEYVVVFEFGFCDVGFEFGSGVFEGGEALVECGEDAGAGFVVGLCGEVEGLELEAFEGEFLELVGLGDVVFALGGEV